jgi:hypothetical protein
VDHLAVLLVREQLQQELPQLDLTVVPAPGQFRDDYSLVFSIYKKDLVNFFVNCSYVNMPSFREISVVDPHWFQCGSGYGSSFFLLMRIRIQIPGFDDHKLEKIYS